MGAAVTRSLLRVLPDSSQGSVWVQNERGPTLRKLFGAYCNPDLWAVYRRLRRVDAAGSGWLSELETQDLLGLPEFNLLFLWDLLSHQNELVNGRELLTTVCVFSSASLVEKARFLITVFDDSRTGSCTGAEVAHACVSVLGVLGRCTGVVVKPKEVAAGLRDDLPALLPEFMNAVRSYGGDRSSAEKCFQKDRMISQIELDKLLPSLRAAYMQLPISGTPPPDAMSPPDADWGTDAPTVAAPEQAPEVTLLQAGAMTPAGGGQAAVRALTASRSQAQLGAPKTELQMMAVVEQEEHDMAAAARAVEEAREREAAAARAREEAARAKVVLPPAKATLDVHGHSFESIESQLATWKYRFTKGISSALGINSSCIEILDMIEPGVKVVFEFRPTGRGGDHRTGMDLVHELEAQLSSGSSHFRRGIFKEYAASAELLWEGKPQVAADLAAKGLQPRVMCDSEAYAEDLQVTLQEILDAIEAERIIAELSESRLLDAQQDLVACCAALEAEKSAQAIRRQEERQKNDEERRRREQERRWKAEERRRQDEDEAKWEEEEEVIKMQLERERKAKERERFVDQQRRLREEKQDNIFGSSSKVLTAA